MTLKVSNANPIVMVDDNPGDAELARICCERSRIDNDWLWFDSGPTFLDHLALVRAGTTVMPALVLLDINMPVMSGLEVLEQVRADDFFGQLPIFCMLTSSADSRDRQAAERLGASGFVTKPGRIADYVAFFDGLAA